MGPLYSGMACDGSLTANGLEPRFWMETRAAAIWVGPVVGLELLTINDDGSICDDYDWPDCIIMPLIEA
jgi:hypothetical protein